MNIFILNTTPELSAQDHCDRHVIKMVLESAQMLSTAHRVLDSMENAKHNELGLYKATHINHPCNVWVRESRANYEYLWELFFFLGEQYRYRYGREHKTITKLLDPLYYTPNAIPRGGLTPFALAVPDMYKCMIDDGPIEVYRTYYLGAKHRIAEWRYSPTPTWWV